MVAAGIRPAPARVRAEIAAPAHFRASLRRGVGKGWQSPSPTMPDQPLKTVRVPEPMAPLFRKAEEVVSRYFAQREDHPETGSIEIFGQRHIRVRAAALSGGAASSPPAERAHRRSAQLCRARATTVDTPVTPSLP